MSNTFLASIIAVAIKHLFVGFFALCSAFASAAGWNDFERDIGHGFRLAKMSSFDVCIYQVGSSAHVCGDKSKGNYGPVSGYFFTDKHLLVRTHGAKYSEIYKHFKTDTAREHFFIMKKTSPSRGRNTAIGPLDRDEFYKNPVVPAAIQWKLPTRFGSTNERETSLIGSVIAWPVALLIVFGPILIWPIVFFCIAWWILKRLRNRTHGHD